MKIRWFLPFITTIFIMAAVFYFSAQNSENSSALSIKITEKIIKLISSVQDLTPVQKSEIIFKIHSAVRKSAHLLVYLFIGFSSAAMFCRMFPYRGFCFVFAAAVLFCVLYAVSDELHQHFVSGRSPEMRDVMIDFIGSAIGAAAYVIKKKIRII